MLIGNRKLIIQQYFSDFLNDSPNTKFQILENGTWSVETDLADKEILPTTQNKVDLDNKIILGDLNLIAPDFTENRPYSSKTTAGYLRFKLDGDWGHAIYAKALAEYAKNVPPDDPAPPAPLPLFDPQLLEVSLDYDATQCIDSMNPMRPTSRRLPFTICIRLVWPPVTVVAIGCECCQNWFPKAIRLHQTVRRTT